MVIVRCLAESPLVRLTTPTVPEIGATSVAASRSSLAAWQVLLRLQQGRPWRWPPALALDELELEDDDDFFAVVSGVDGLRRWSARTSRSAGWCSRRRPRPVAFAQACSSALVGSLASIASSWDADGVGSDGRGGCLRGGRRLRRWSPPWPRGRAAVRRCAHGSRSGRGRCRGPGAPSRPAVADGVEVRWPVGVAVAVGSGSRKDRAEHRLALLRLSRARPG